MNFKYYILEKSECPSINILHSFATEKERDIATQKLIFGEEPSGDAQRDEWAKYAQILHETGTVYFEADPGLEWFMAMEAGK